MGDNYKKLPVNAIVTDQSRTVYNDTIDMLRWWKTQRSQTGAGSQKGVVDWDQTLFPVKNNSGADLPASYGILGLNGPLYSPTDNIDEFLNVTPWEGVEPTVEDHAGGRWCVVLEPLRNGEISRKACLAGVVPVRVYVNSPSDTSCDIIDAETVGGETCYLGTGGSGKQILWLDPDAEAEEIAWALVKLDSSPADDGSVLFYNDSEETAPANCVLKETARTAAHNDCPQNCIICTKPDTAYTNYYINSGQDVAAGEYGRCYADGTRQALSIANSGYVWNSKPYGPATGSWYLQYGYPGFASQSWDSSGRGWFRFDRPQVLVGTTSATLSRSTSSGGKASCNLKKVALEIYDRFSMPDTPMTVDGYDYLLTDYTSIASGTDVVLVRLGDLWCISEARCAV